MDTVQDYKCVHCGAMYTCAQSWLEHSRRHRGDSDLKVFVRHVSFSEKAANRRPMFVLKNFHMKVRDLEGKKSSIDSDLQIKTTDVDANGAGVAARDGQHGSAAAKLKVNRMKLANTSKSRSMDSSLTRRQRRPHTLDSALRAEFLPSLNTSPWWQRKPMASGSTESEPANIHRGMGSLTVTLSKSTSSLTDNELSLSSMDWASEESLDKEGSRHLHGDVSNFLDISKLALRSESDGISQNLPSNRPRTCPEDRVQINAARMPSEGTTLDADTVTNSPNFLTAEQRQSSRSTSSRYLRSDGGGLGVNKKQQTLQRVDPRPLSSDSDFLRDAPGEDVESTTPGSRGVLNNGRGQWRNDFMSSLRESDKCQSYPPKLASADDIRTVDQQPGSLAAGDTSSDNRTCNTPTADKVTQWINRNKFIDNIPDPEECYSYTSDTAAEEASGTKHDTDIRNLNRTMGNNSTIDSRIDSKKHGHKPRTGTRSVQGVGDIGKINNRYSTGALMDIARVGSQLSIHTPQLPGSSKRKTLTKQKHTQDDINIAKMSEILPVDAFRKLCKSDTFDATVKAFDELRFSVGLRPNDRSNYYNQIKNKVSCSEAAKFFRLLDFRLNQEEYGGGKICQKTTVLVIGGGPCGLRTAIECALLGAKVVVLEMRNYATRNNVLHLWPTAANDIKAVGAKVFYPKFCTSAIHHVSIRRLQLILMKTALILGVEIHAPVTFEELVPPNPEKGTGWRARVSPGNCPANNLEFQVVVGADGKKNSLDFPRKFTRGKVSIAITANFKNPNTGLHSRVSEIPGVILVRRPELFSELTEKTGLEFENFVYFRDETHYFITTAKKKSIVDQCIVKKETADLRAMFQPDNINQEKLLQSVRTIAETCWRVDNPSFTELPELEFVLDRYGREDVNIFDFAALHQAEHASMIKERHGHKLLMCIVGDTLLEPFWPTGSGIAKGFLGCLDASWAIRNWVSGKMSDLDVIAEREGIFRVLPQVAPTSLLKDKCTIDPKTRYGTSFGVPLTLNQVKVKDVQHLYNTTGAVKRKSCGITFQDIPKEKRRLYRGGSIDTHRLVGWFKDKLSGFSHLVKVTDLAKSWTNGLALCALVQTERPDLLDVSCMDKHDCRANIQKAFNIIEQEFGVEQMMSPDDLAGNDEPDRLTMMSYLFHIYEYIVTKDDVTEINVSAIDKGGSGPVPGHTRKPSAYSLLHTIANQAVLLRTLERDARRVRDMDVNRLARQTSVTGQTAGMDYFLQTASLDRRAKSKVHMAVRRTKSIKPDQVARKWRRKTQEKKQRRQAMAQQRMYENVSPHTDDTKENTVPMGTRAKPRHVGNKKETLDAGYRRNNKTVSEKENDDNSTRKGVKFAEDAKTDDGPSEQLTEDEEEERRRMMSLPRQACGGVASKAIQAFRDLENKENQNDATPSPTRLDGVDCNPVPDIDRPEHSTEPRTAIARRAAFRGSQEIPDEEKNKGPLKRRSAVRNNSKAKADEPAPGVNTLKRTGEICCLCNKKLYLVERFNAQGHFLHRHCFKCHQCSTNLRVGNYVMVEDKRGEPKFYCCAHAYQAGALNVTWDGPSVDSEEADDDTLKKSQERINQDFCGPLTDDELRYIDDDDDTTDEEDIDEVYAANLPAGADQYSTLSLRSIIDDLDSKVKEQYRNDDLDDLRSNVTDTSSQLLQQEVIQQGLDDVQHERDQLEEDGVELEKQIRGESGDRLSKCQDDQMNAWLEMARKKQELNEKESKLMLQLRLMGLQERLKAMLEMMPVINESETSAMEAKVEKMEAATAKMEKAAIQEDLVEMMDQMRNMKTFLGKSDC